MLNAYYSKECDSAFLFRNLNISRDESYLKHLNKHNVIWIDMASLYSNIKDKNVFVDKLKEFIYLDLKENFNDINIDYDMEDGT